MAETTASYPDQVFDQLNKKRTEIGLKPFVKDRKITRIANVRAEELTRLFSLERPGGKSFFSIFDEYDFPYADISCNIFSGQRTPADLAGYMSKSSDFRKNVLGTKKSHLAVGYAVGANGTPYWVLVFMTPAKRYEDDPDFRYTPTVSCQEQVFNLTNRERVSRGLQPLKPDAGLSRLAAIRAKELITLYSHTRPGQKNCFSVLKENGYEYIGAAENIAKGQKTSVQVVEGWMNSSGHRKNILNPKLTHLGVGYIVDSAGNTYWAQLFAIPL